MFVCGSVLLKRAVFASARVLFHFIMLPVLNLLSASVAKNQHFRPCRKNDALGRKMIHTFYNCHDLYQRAKFGEDRTTRYGCRSESWCFLYVTLGLPARGGHSSNKYCVTVCESILMRFSALFQN